MILDKACIKEVEHGIAPSMDAAITIPVEIEGLRGVVIYVALCPRGQGTGSTYREEETLKDVAERLSLDVPSEITSQPITDFGWGTRVRKCFVKLGITTMGQLAGKTANELLAVKHFGRTGLVEVERQLATVGLALKKDKRWPVPTSLAEYEVAK